MFSTLDLNSSYWNVEVSKEDRVKTTFASHYGLFQIILVPFELINAPGTFQRVMDVILLAIHWQIALVYLNDIVKFLKSLKAYIKRMRHVLTLVCRAGVITKLRK